METPRVVFVAGDPGGAAALLPVIQGWPGHKIVFSYRHSGKIFRDGGLETNALEEGGASTAAAGEWIERTHAALVVGATSVNGVDWERHFFVAARERRIPSLSLVDYWSNYTPRFTLSQRLDALPDAIAVMDERARSEMVTEGFPLEQLFITGQPVLDEVRRWRTGITTGDRARFREQLGLSPQERAYLFVSQPLREMRLTTGSQPGTGDDEFAALENLTKAIHARSANPKVLLVKLHPREDANRFDSILSALPFPARVVATHLHRWEVCLGADLIFGMNSMLLEEALAMKCRVSRIGSAANIELNVNAPAGTGAEMPDAVLPLATTRITQLIIQSLEAQPRQLKVRP